MRIPEGESRIVDCESAIECMSFAFRVSPSAFLRPSPFDFRFPTSARTVTSASVSLLQIVRINQHAQLAIQDCIH